MKTVKYTLVISAIVLAVLGGAGYWVIQKMASDHGEELKAVAEKIEQRQSDPVTEESVEVAETGKKPQVDMEETRVQITLHQMTHQKITADKKRGAVEMSSDNIEDLLTIVRANFDGYEHAEFYEETLLAWEKGDFSNAVTVHNTIWNWHSGTVGRATGLMSAEQEAEYVEKNFR